MKTKLYKFLDKILQVNFNTCDFKFVYLYNEVFISIICNNDFLFLGISLKANKLLINNYSGEYFLETKKLLVLIKKYEEYFKKFLKELQKNSNNIGDESDFINIYDKKELSYLEVKNKLYFSFLDDYTFRRRSEMDFSFENKSELSIYHSDFECSKCDGPKETFTNFPNFRDIRIDKKYFKNIESKNKYTGFVTNISDYESIAMGGNEKINDILSNKKLIEDHELITINKTCISVIMGDDIKSILKYNKIPEEKTIYTDQNTDSGYRTVINFLKKIKLNNKIEKNNEIVFFGLNKNKNTFEIIKFLELNFEIKVGNVLLPNIDKEDLENILKYNFAVFFRGKEVKAQSIFKLYPIKNFEIKVPYSLSENITLYKNILEKYNKNNEIKKLEEIIGKIKIENNNLYEKAKNIEIGFIISDFHIKKFLDDNFRGVDILNTLSDMGFEINFFIFSDNNKYLEDKNNFDKLNYNLIYSDKREELNDFIKNKKIKLYYSEINNDKRILTNNKEIFSIGDFEYGIDGFFRTFNKLLKKCEKVDYLNNIYYE